MVDDASFLQMCHGIIISWCSSKLGVVSQPELLYCTHVGAKWIGIFGDRIQTTSYYSCDYDTKENSVCLTVYTRNSQTTFPILQEEEAENG